ncbi:MAG: aspartate aminotransferase family protein [Acidobacteria bacterium]|nr:aspartate aminotransferase family protein [Acidobacteriota bacterium]
MLDRASLRVLSEALAILEQGFSSLPPTEQTGGADPAFEGVLREVAERLRDNYPYFHPLYAGQMLKPPHPIARAAYALAMWINPNNHALDGGRATSAMEKEAVAGIAAMFGWSAPLGHLTGGGTMANLEALWIGRQLSPGTVLASSSAHYTHGRISAVLGVPFEEVPSDARGRMDTDALAGRLARGGVSTVVATMGTTATGSVDPLAEILALRKRHGFRLHADAAYGGYFGLVGDLAPETRRAFDGLGEADSIVVDPHKHGLQPYGCGCVLFRDPAVGRFYKHDSPYTYFSSTELHLGEISLECSRPGAAAAGLWATSRLLPLTRGGEFARGLSRSLSAARALHALIQKDSRFLAAFDPELDIVVWLPRARTAKEASARSRRLFEEAARRDLHLALAELPLRFFGRAGAAIGRPDETATCLRSVLMKPEHADWVERIWGIVVEAAGNSGVER